MRGIPLCLAVLVACAASSSGTRVESPYLHPALVPPARPMAALSPSRAPLRTTAKPPVKPRPARGAAVSSRRADAAVTAAVDWSSLGGDPDRRRAEVVQSARRVLGIQRSFDARSFLGHILRVNDLLPDGTRAETYTAESLRRDAEAAGLLVTPREALPGDLVLFSCDNGCGPIGSDRAGAGVVLRSYGDGLEFICYADSRVQLCHHGMDRPRTPSKRVGGVLGVVSLEPRAHDKRGSTTLNTRPATVSGSQVPSTTAIAADAADDASAR